MTIDEAMENINHYLANDEVVQPEVLFDALRLGVEALRIIKRARDFKWQGWPLLLQDETKQ